LAGPISPHNEPRRPATYAPGAPSGAPMEPIDRLARLDGVSRRLAFGLDDHSAVNAAYVRWRDSRDDSDLEPVEVWAYCFVQRHALVRFVREPHLGSPADLDALISSTFLHVRSRLGDVRDASRFSHWVAVACRNGFLTYCRRRAGRPAMQALDTAPDPACDEPTEPLELDRAVIRRVVRGAIARLPETLRPVATMRLLEGRPYESIASTTGHPAATIRSYVAKSIAKLRSDPELQALRDELQLATPARRDPEESRHVQTGA